jgi:DNA-binding NarL/FixJ family response regulator
MANHADNRSTNQRAAIRASVSDIAAKLARAVAPVVDGCLPPLTAVDRRLPDSRNAKTNPPTVPDARLRARHLAVARMMVDGKTNPQIAAALGVTRQAVWKWSRLPSVVAEVERAHGELLKSSGHRLTKVDRG